MSDAWKHHAHACSRFVTIRMKDGATHDAFVHAVDPDTGNLIVLTSHDTTVHLFFAHAIADILIRPEPQHPHQSAGSLRPLRHLLEPQRAEPQRAEPQRPAAAAPALPPHPLSHARSRPRRSAQWIAEKLQERRVDARVVCVDGRQPNAAAAALPYVSVFDGLARIVPPFDSEHCVRSTNETVLTRLRHLVADIHNH